MREYDVAVIGGGPAGLAAAAVMAGNGADTILIDENARPGGQLFKQIHKFFGSREHYAGVRGFDIGKKLLGEVAASGAEICLMSTAAGIFRDNRILIVHRTPDGTETAETVKAGKILIATGGQENALHFEGWTIPGVMGAGCAQTMINVNQVLPGQKVLMVGSGNVGLMVSYQLLQAGASVVGLVEAADHIGGYGVHAAKLSRAGIPFYLRHTVVKAEAGKDGSVCRAFIAEVDERFRPVPGTEKCLDADTICIAAGLRPVTKLAAMAGARMIFVPEMGGWMPWHDDTMKTSLPDVYIAGDIAGVEEASTAMEEGRLAGWNILRSLDRIGEEEAKKRSAEVRERLRALRYGSFGDRRYQAKKRIEEEM